MNWLLGDIIEKNISKRVFVSICIVAIALSLLDFLFTFISETSDLSTTYRLKDAFLFSLFSMPASLYQYLSYICLLGVLTGLGSLKEEGEIIASKVLGKSNWSMVIASLRPVLLIILSGFIFQEISLPSISQTNEENKLIKQNRLSSDEGYSIASESSLAFFQSSPNRELIRDITIYEIDQNTKIVKVINSKTAIKQVDKWILVGSEIKNLQTQSKSFKERMIWRDGPDESDMRRILSPKYFSLKELGHAIKEEVSEYRKNNLKLEYWRKIFHPIMTIFLVFLATSFIFGSVRDPNLGQRLLIGILFAFSLNMAQNLFESMAVVSFIKPLMAVLLPLIIILLLTILVWQWRSSKF